MKMSHEESQALMATAKDGDIFYSLMDHRTWLKCVAQSAPNHFVRSDDGGKHWSVPYLRSSFRQIYAPKIQTLEMHEKIFVDKLIAKTLVIEDVKAFVNKIIEGTPDDVQSKSEFVWSEE